SPFTVTKRSPLRPSRKPSPTNQPATAIPTPRTTAATRVKRALGMGTALMVLAIVGPQAGPRLRRIQGACSANWGGRAPVLTPAVETGKLAPPNPDRARTQPVTSADNPLDLARTVLEPGERLVWAARP